jgi:hypothetical protein
MERREYNNRQDSGAEMRMKKNVISTFLVDISFMTWYNKTWFLEILV